MSHQVGHAGEAPHQGQKVEEVSTDSDAFQQGNADARTETDLNPADAMIRFDEAADLACPHECGVAPGSIGCDGAALLSIATLKPRGAIVVAASVEGPPTSTPAVPRSVPQETPADQVLIAASPSDSPPVDDCSGGTGAAPSPHDHEAARRGWDRQADRRWNEYEFRKRSVDFSRSARARGWSTRETAQALGLAPRTLWHWDQSWNTDRLAPRPRGKPPRIAPAQRQAEVSAFLDWYGPSISLSTLRAEYPDVARAELSVLRAGYRADWRREHVEEPCRLEWLQPGGVWAMDLTHPPHRVDGVFPAILNVLDLASHNQLLWLAVDGESAATVVEALADLFAEHGPPLVIKCDNGPGFRAGLTKRFLLDRTVFTLYSPPYCPQYNGACERANRTLKELTAHVADQAGRPGFWTSDDLLVARLRANRLSRPWGPTGPTPEENWNARGVLSLDKRKNMWHHLRSGIGAVLDQREIDPAAALPHYTQTEIERIAAQPILEQLGLLHVSRRRITPAF